MITKIQVTQEDINTGIPRSCSNCPISNAIYRITGIEYYVGIISIWPRGQFISEIVSDMPKVALDFRKAYDEPGMIRFGDEIKPFEFEIDLKG